jgi:hypothetical protein
MTTIEQLALANEKIEHWRGKTERAAGILSKWQSRLTQLQAKDKAQAQVQAQVKDKPQATVEKLPTPTLVIKNSEAVVNLNRKAMALAKANKTKPTKPPKH